MKRYNIIRLFSSYLQDNDLAVFVGSNICKEAYLYDRDGNFYIEDETGYGISLALGIAINTDKRVFIFCDDYYFIKDMSILLHIGISQCRNIFLVVLDSGEYQHSGHNPTIFSSMSTPKTLMFGAGFIVNDYTKHFSNVESSKHLIPVLKNLHGPIFILIKIDLGEKKKIGEINLTVTERLRRLSAFLSVKGTSMYTYDEPHFSFNKGEK